MEFSFPISSIPIFGFITPLHLFYAIVLMSVAIGGEILGMFLLLLRKNRRQKHRKRLRKLMTTWIGEVVLLEETDQSQPIHVPAAIRNLLQFPIARKVLMRELVSLKKNIYGSAADNLCRLYKELGLYHESVLRLRSKKWHMISRGIQELATMEQKPFAKYILRLTNHPNAHVRMEAQTAMVYLFGFPGLRFLDVIRYPLSEWHQLSLLHLLIDQSIEDETKIRKWISSSNESIVLFILKLISLIQDLRFEKEVRSSLHHNSERVRIQGIQSLNDMGLIVSDEQLRELFIRGGKDIKIKIVQIAGLQSNLNLQLQLQNMQHLERDQEVLLVIRKSEQQTKAALKQGIAKNNGGLSDVA